MSNEFIDKKITVRDVIIEYTEIGNGARDESYIDKCRNGEYEHSVSYKEYGSNLRCSNMFCSRGTIDIGIEVFRFAKGDKEIVTGGTGCNAPEKGKRIKGFFKKTCGNTIYYRLRLVK